jgi:hypothetical protein
MPTTYSDFPLNQGTSSLTKIETRIHKGVLIDMKTLNLILGASFLMFGTVVSRAANLDRISAETGVPVATLQAERASTGLGWGGLEKAHLLANASGQSFDTIVARFRGGEGWGQIAHAYGLNLGKVVSSARRSSKATIHTQKVHGQKTHGKSATKMGRGHTKVKSSVGHGSSFGSGLGRSHGMGQASMGKGGGGR